MQRSSLVALFVASLGCGRDAVIEPSLLELGGTETPEGARTEANGNATSPQPARWRLTPDQIRLGDNLELAPNRAVMNTDGPVEEPNSSPEALARAAARSDSDPTWRDANGDRYEALLVLEDGTVFGRKGAAPAAAAPTAENSYGGWKGVEPSEEEVQRAIAELERVERGEATEEEVARAGTITLPQPETVILGGTLASDRRFRVTSVATLQSYPHRTIGALNGTVAAGFTGCTGTKVGPRHVLTASHCVLDEEGIWTGSGQFHPGQTNSTHPNAGGTAIAWSGVYARDWRGGRRWDYALLYLVDRQDSANLGWVGMYWWGSGVSYASRVVTVWGYPDRTSTDPLRRCQASVLNPKDCGGWMYGQSAILTSGAFVGSGPYSEQLTYDLDTTRGQSGSSVLWTDGGGWSTLGVHWGGPVDSRNSSARMRTSMHADICDWIKKVTSVWATNPC